MRRLVTVLPLLMLYPLLQSCVVSKHPLSDPKTAAADNRIAGIWKTTGSSTYYHVFPRDKKMMDVIIVNHDSSVDDPLMLFKGFVTRIDGETYLNLKHVIRRDFRKGKTKLHKNYVIMKYELSAPDRASLWYLKTDVLEKAVESGRLKGRVLKKKTKGGEKVLLTDSTENLVDFIRNYPGTLFKKLEDLERIAAPPPAKPED